MSILRIIREVDRVFRVSLARVWNEWCSVLILVKPEIIRLIQQMSRENPLWGAPRIRSELLLLGYVVPTVTFRLFFCFVILSHDRRRILHLNTTAHPTAEWAAQQITEAFPGDGTEPRFLLRDRDGVYGEVFRQRVKTMGLQELLTAPQSPWQNPYAERIIGSIFGTSSRSTPAITTNPAPVSLLMGMLPFPGW